jgi:hypothetical protein
MHTMHLLPSVALQPNLELKTWPKLLLGYLPLAFALPVITAALKCIKLLKCIAMSERLIGKGSKIDPSQLSDTQIAKDYYRKQSIRKPTMIWRDRLVSPDVNNK